MTAASLSVLLIDADAPLRAALARAPLLLLREIDDAASTPDAVVFRAVSRAALQALAAEPRLSQAAVASAVLVCTEIEDAGIEAALLAQGVQAIVAADAALPRAIRHAVLRREAERQARSAYATDLATGLPHQAQLLEHLTQLLALREREPGPMVLIVLRVDGYAAVAGRLGGEAANVLRRKVAVRLRSGLRASDVVAAIGPDAFGVLLGHLEAPSDGERVAAKLVRSLEQPLTVAGHACVVQAALGLAHYPQHGKDAQSLLRRASAQASSVATLGAHGVASAAERGPGDAANDDAGH